MNEQRLSRLAAEPVEKADADFVRQRTGFVAGGVPPVGHTERLEIFIDEDLLQSEELWAAAGTPHAVFQLTPAELKAMTGDESFRSPESKLVNRLKVRTSILG